MSFILIFTQDTPEKPTPIVLCDYEDLYNYLETGEFKYKIDKWDSFTDFFEYLVEQEERDLALEKYHTPLPPISNVPEKKFWEKAAKLRWLMNVSITTCSGVVKPLYASILIHLLIFFYIF